MITANATNKYLPRTAGRIGFARAATMLGASRVELAGHQPWSCGVEHRQGSPGPGDA